MATMDRCPICDVSVRPENLIRHLNDIHPRHPDTPRLLERLRAEPGRIPRRSAGRPIRLRPWHVVRVALLRLGGLGGDYLLPIATLGPAVPAIGGEVGGLWHWLTRLYLLSWAGQFAVPASLGS